MRAVDYAVEDWKAMVSEANVSSLDEMFSTAGWSPKAPRPPARIVDWCGFATYLWLRKAGLSLAHRKSFYHTENVEAFYTYGSSKNTNPKRLMKAGLVAGLWDNLYDIHMREGRKASGDGSVAEGHLRMWMSAGTIREIAVGYDLRPDDTILINHYGSTASAHHITTVLDYSPKTNILTTIEGNASGLGGDGQRRRDSVVVVKRYLNNKTHLNKLYGWGRISVHDLDHSIIEAYR